MQIIAESALTHVPNKA